MVENGHSSTKAHTFKPHTRDQKNGGVPNPHKYPEVHADWMGLGHMSTSEPITVWLVRAWNPLIAPSLGVNGEAKPEKNRRQSGRAILQITNYSSCLKILFYLVI